MLALNRRFKMHLPLPVVKVLDIDVLVRGSLALAPQEQSFFGSHLFHRDVLDSKSENNGPNHTQGHLDVAINDF